MKSLLVIGLFFVPVLVAIGVFWLMASNDAGPDPSSLSRGVEVVVLDYREELRSSSSNRHAYHFVYTYQVNGTTYAADEFVPLSYGPPPERSLSVCINPGSPDEHALRLYPDDPPCGKVGGEPQPATPILWEGSAPQSQ